MVIFYVGSGTDTSPAFTGYMEGAVRSGRATATRVVRWLEGDEGGDEDQRKDVSQQWTPYKPIVDTGSMHRWGFVLGMVVLAFIVQFYVT